MQSIDVALADRSYQVHVGHDCLPHVGELCRACRLGSRVAVVVDEALTGRYLEPVQDGLRAAGYQPLSVEISGGDDAKNLATVDAVVGRLVAAELDRGSWILALGGGVVGDLAGFVAATFLRGVDFVQVPTTIVAQVDASVGGKTAVNHSQGKNLIGAFHQPRLVCIDTGVLATLPPRERIGGMGEVIKHAVIRDPELFAFLEANLEAAMAGQLRAPRLDWLIARNVAIKAAVVAADPCERGLRAILNYGHTVGHAIEAVTGYSRYRHGEAVILGMLVAGELAVQQGLWSAAERDRQDALLQRLTLPPGLEQLDANAIVARTRADKKRHDGSLRFVLGRAIGCVEVVDGVSEAAVYEAILAVQQRG